MTTGPEQVVLVDASVFITLAGIGRVRLLEGLEGQVVVPPAVREEIVDEPAAGALDRAIDDSGWLGVVEHPAGSEVDVAAEQLGGDDRAATVGGDVSLLAHALGTEAPVVVSDDRPLRRTCEALGVPVSGSIGVVVAAVERGDLGPDEAKDALVSMDEVGARLSARLLRAAEALIEEAADEAGG